jgi:hypothetical protein
MDGLTDGKFYAVLCRSGEWIAVIDDRGFPHFYHELFFKE